MAWQPIEDISSSWQSLASSELPPLVTVWNEQAERLRASGEFKVFMERLRREIAIETGIIERLYNIDRGITRLLIEQGINEALIPHGATDRPVKQVVSLIRDQETAIEGLFDFVGGQRNLSTSYIKQLHQVLTQNQQYTEALVPSTGEIVRVSLIMGDWKRLPNNPMRPDGIIHEYCPPEQVASEMDRLIELHHQHRNQQIPPEVESAWLHHRFTQIHPFQDGNGRVARCIASLVFIQAGWFPLVLTRDDRADYIAALEQADQGNLSKLIALFAKSQKQAFIRSLGLSEQVLSESRRTQVIIASIAEKLKQNQSASIQERSRKVEYFASKLFEIASNRSQDVANEIKLSVQNLFDDADAFIISAPAGDSRSYYHRYQIVETAKQLRYFANLRNHNYHSWIQLVINIGISTTILLSFHVLGHEYRGLLVCSACAYHRDNAEDGERNISDIQALTDSPFQFSYADEEGNLTERFKQWLEDVIVTGLEYWNKSL
ncbi:MULTISPECIES: Fic family protein [unclassified Nostoc]|uniref:Fic family protein n=1 Tax=unclassified Nostoc TaxID=2593658 RepID=UPI0025AB071C|nr:MULTISPECIES: Fic family protein [unclassified Nostoc]MDM9586012.1 Fic family protein [Nostoc sp. GT001]MDZ7947543.1 Fic family protein [Nostoc sp. EfeVER01]MDZ7994189.1 Fic family protein [Nostoc sp. EspVER01]